jgi:hypothetical protein
VPSASAPYALSTLAPTSLPLLAHEEPRGLTPGRKTGSIGAYVETTTVAGLDYTWDADLTVTGCHEGFLEAATVGFIGIIAPQSITGTAVAEYDGVRVEGLPEPPWGEGP